MSKQEFIQNTFEKGMYKDALPERQPAGTYTYALNATHESNEHSDVFVNEESNRKWATVPGTIVGGSFIEERNATLYFSSDGGLYLVSHDENDRVDFIMRDSEAGCDWGFGKCEFMYGVFKNMQPCNEVHVYFSACCEYYVVNIDEMLNQARRDCALEQGCDYFKLFRCICGPKITPVAIDGGGFLAAGAYQFVAQLEDNDGNQTNWFDLTQPVYVGSENNIGGEIGNQSIKIQADQLEKGYNVLNIAVIKRIKGVVTAEILPPLAYSSKSITYEYYGDNPDVTPIQLHEVLIKGKKYLRGKDVFQKDGRLFLYCIRQDILPNYQKYANEIRTEWVEFEVTAEANERYHFPSLMRGENYAVGIVLKYCDGTYSHAFHIPGGVGGPGGLSTPPSQFTSGSGGSATSQTGDEAKGTVQYKDGTYDSSNSFERKRDPSCDDVEDENVELEQRILEDIDNIETQERPEAADGAEHYGEFFQTPELGTAWQQDVDDVSDMIQNSTENLIEYSQDNGPPKDCPPLNQNATIKETAQDLMQRGVIDREYEELGKTEWTFDKGGRYDGAVMKPQVGFPMSKGDFNRDKIEGETASFRGDQWVNAWGEDMIEICPAVINTGVPEVYESNLEYPIICDCEGNRMYPEGNIKHHKMPDNCESTHFVSNTVGVPHKKDGANDELHDTFVRPLGLMFSNVYLPTEDCLPKPLCPISPFKIVIAKRDLNDRTVIAKGLTTGCFEGDIKGRTHAFPRHGVNSFETVDRYVEQDSGSKIASGGNPNASYNFHSLDTNAQKIPLLSTEYINYFELYGSGWRHGMYAKGQKPDKWYTDTRIDQRGTRQAVSLPGQVCSASRSEMVGVTYAPADTIVSGPDLKVPLMNRMRESSVFFQLEGTVLPGLQNGINSTADSSFVGDVLDHECPIKTAAAHYGALYRELPDQYGTVENMRYIDSGLNGTIAHGRQAPGSRVTVYGLTGDVFIGPYSFRRTGYVSNKVGDDFPVSGGSDDGRQSDWKRDRSVCDHPADLSQQYLGLNHWPTRLPESGDVSDPKNWAGLHTGGGITYSCEGAATRTVPDSDFYYPKVVKTLITYWGEFEVNPYFRQTGVGPQIEEGKVFYPKLKDLYLDSSAPDDRPWEESWLNRFYVRVEQPSIATLSRKAMIRTALGLIAPLWAAAMAVELETPLDGILAIVVFPLLAAGWNYMLHTTFRDEWVDKILGIPRCKTDEEGGEDERCNDCPKVVGFEDNYHAYQHDFSVRNDIESFYGIPRSYSTCKCDDCYEDETTNEIYYSEKQVLTSQMDAYRNFKSNNYLFIPAHSGYLRKLVVEANRFYAHCTDGMWLMQYNNISIPSNTGNIILGKGDLLRDPQLIMEQVWEGYAGLQDRNASISCGRGYFWPDAEGASIYRMIGGKVERISDLGLKNFFETSLPFCKPEDCRDEKVSGVYYSLGYDHRHDRLLFTKKDGDACSSWTASYDPIKNIWISFHSYIPMMYIWDRDRMFSVEPGTGNIWVHDDNREEHQVFYGKYQPFIVDFPVRHESGGAWEYASTVIDTEASQAFEDDYLYERHITFNKMAVWSGVQSSGTHEVIPWSDSPDLENNLIAASKDFAKDIRAVYEGKQWRVNRLSDFIVDCEAKVISKECECSPFPVLRDTDCGRLNKQTTKARIIYGRYLVHRYILDKEELKDHKLYLKSNLTLVTDQEV